MMSEGAWKFRPGLWPTIATLILLPLFVRLGFWQLDRADQKAALQQAYTQQRSEPPVDLAAEPARRSDREAMLWRECLLRGEYLPQEQYLLDNQIENEAVGYLVYTPFRLAGQETVVLVNRGWIPLGARRDVVPVFATPRGPVEIRGMAKAPQSTGLVLGGGGVEKLGRGLVRLQHLDLAALAKSRNWDLLPYVVRLEPERDSHFVRDWAAPGFGRERHLGYAFQWFLMAAVLVVLYVVLNTRRNNANED
jgi:surfeit locus 1 family protein